MHHQISIKPLRQHLRAAILAVSIGSVAAMPAFAAEPNAAQHEYHIPAGPLSQALSRFAAEAGILLSADAALADSKTSAGLNGRYSVDAGLEALLKGSGLHLQRLGEKRYSVTAIPAKGDTLPELHVSASQNQDADNLEYDGRHSYAAVRSISAAKSNASLLETPRTINVITREQMDHMGVQTITEALRYTPGVVLQYSNTDSRYDWMTVRGFTPPTRYLDGLRLPFGANGYSQTKIDPYLLQRVEVLKGPASSLYGQSSPGGILALSSKLPTDIKRGEIQLQSGRYDRQQAAFDISGPIDEEGRILYRLIGLGRDADTQTRHVEDDKYLIAPSLTIKPNENVSLTLLAHYQKIDSRGGAATALPVQGTLQPYGNWGRLPTSTFIGEKNYDRYVNEQSFLGYMFSYIINPQSTFRQNVRYTRVDTDSRRVQGTCLSANNCLPTNLIRYAWAFPEVSDMLTIDNQLDTRFNTAGLEHRMLLGVDYTYEEATYRESNLNIINLMDYNAYLDHGALSLTAPAWATKIDSSQRQLGFYLQDQIKWSNWGLQLGVRHDDARKTNKNLAYGSGGTSRVTNDDNALSGNIALSYTFAGQLTPYVSFASSFQPSTGVDSNGSPLDATKGKQYEAGVKYRPSGMDALLNLSAYKINQRNIVTTAPDGSRMQTGEVEIKGVELEGKASLGHGVEALASYAYTDSEITKTSASTQLGNELAFVPRHQSAAWLYHTATSGILDGMSFGLGARYLAGSFGENENLYKTNDVTLLDATLRYDLAKANPKFKGFSLQVNAANLADKKYVATCIAAAGCYYGDRRNIYTTLKYQW
ncbi:TonB-dependent siderophore receptor [Methylobacillus sp. Pita2]|uniref:TonB-dependent siderophore receptor n=1 Tax=Methylobacillus sp. Pita2 TaxID=3383245 RepID=UPI0038B4247F